jgi:hypothetical protein
MSPCSEPKCVGLATVNGQCAAHAAGYRLHESSDELRCENCRRQIRKDQWYRVVGGSVMHVRPCVPHPEVVKERDAAAQRA